VRITIKPTTNNEGAIMKSLCGIVAVILAFSAMPALAKPPTINLQCGKLPSFESERKDLSKVSGAGDIYNIDVTFIAKKPGNKQIDKILRECLAEAIKLDNSKDILATAWYRPKQGANPNDDEMIDPYGALKYISFTASTKSVAVHSITLGKK
jgi:hypothetical protein